MLEHVHWLHITVIDMSVLSVIEHCSTEEKYFNERTKLASTARKLQEMLSPLERLKQIVEDRKKESQRMEENGQGT